MHIKLKHLANILVEKKQSVRPFAQSPNTMHSSKGKMLTRSHHQPRKTCVYNNMQGKKQHLNCLFRLIHFR